MSPYFKILKNRNLDILSRRTINFFVYSFLKYLVDGLKISDLPSSPVTISLWTTSRCNKACSFCHYDGSLNHEPKSKDLTFEAYFEKTSSPVFSKNLHLGFYGGEPLLNEDLFKMIKHAQKRRMITTIVTNGIFLKKRAADLASTPPDVVTVSYYDEEHDVLSENLKYVPKKSVRRLNFILSKETVGFIDRALELATLNHFDVFSIEPISDRQRNHKDVIFSDTIEFAELKKRLSEKFKNKISIRWPKTNRYVHKKLSCRYMWDALVLNTKGDWAPCCEWSADSYMPFKNFSWNGSWYKSQRKALLENAEKNKFCKDCICRHDSTMNL